MPPKKSISNALPSLHSYAAVVALCLLASCADGVRPATESANPISAYSEAGAAHIARKNKLTELSETSQEQKVGLYEYLVKKTDLSEADTDQPILRVVFEERVFFDTALSKLR